MSLVVNIVALITTVGGLTITTVVALWATVKLSKWSISTEKDLDVGVAGRIWQTFVLAVVVIELGPALGNTAVALVNWTLQLL